MRVWGTSGKKEGVPAGYQLGYNTSLAFVPSFFIAGLDGWIESNGMETSGGKYYFYCVMWCYVSDSRERYGVSEQVVCTIQ